jgi:hypothetical protein
MSILIQINIVVKYFILTLKCLEHLILAKDNKINYDTFLKDSMDRSYCDTNDGNEKKSEHSNNKSSQNKISSMKFVKFLNTASTFWSKQLCLNKKYE